jgi:hypothetical protein
MQSAPPKPRQGVEASAAAADRARAPGPEDEVRKLLQSWSKAWSDRDAGKHLAHYHPQAVAGTGSSTREWRDRRRAVLSRSQEISVSLSNIDVIVEDSRATATFVQKYASERYSDRSFKRLELLRAEGRWQIVSEVSVLIPAFPRPE